MVGLQAGNGFGGAARRFYSRHHILVLSLTLSLVGVATGTASAAALLQNAAAREPLLFAAGALVAAGCCAVQTRHLALSLLTAVAPLPGLIWAAPLSGGSSFAFVPFVAYAFGFAIAAVDAQAIVIRALDRTATEQPWRAAAAAVGLAVVLAWMWFGGPPFGDAALQLAVDIALAALSVRILLPAAASLLAFDEDFVARANRLRERRQRLAETMALATTPRWALSFLGIALVFAALGGSGAEPVLHAARSAEIVRTAVSLALLAVAAGWATSGWREAVAATFATAVVCLMALWAGAVVAHAPLAFVCVSAPAALTVFFALHGGRCAATYRRQGEEGSVARQRAMEETAVAQVFAGAGAVAALLPALIFHRADAVFAVAMLLAAFGGILFAPAIAGAVETLLPRRRSVEQLYGKR